MVERLSDVYRELQTEDPPVGLEEFIHRACAGEFGPVSREDVRGFLQAVEERLVRRIEEGEETAHEGAARDDLIEETRGWIDDLLTKYCGS